MTKRETFAALVVAAGLAVASVGPAGAASDVLRWTSIAGWDVLIDTTLGNGCFIYTTYDAGTVLRLGYSPDDDEAYLMVGNNKWASIRDGRDYDVQFRMDRDSPWYATATGTLFNGLPMLMAFTDDPNFLVDFAKKNSLQVTYAGSVVATLSLSGTYAAVNEMINCQNQVDRYGTGGRSSDPFAR